MGHVGGSASGGRPSHRSLGEQRCDGASPSRPPWAWPSRSPRAAGGDRQTRRPRGRPARPRPAPTRPLSGTLTIWVDETRQRRVEAAAEKFEEETGATVELVLKNYEDIRADFNAQVPTGEGPDITVGAHDWLGELTANGVVAPIELGDKADEFEAVAVEAFTHDGRSTACPTPSRTSA